MNRTIVPGAIIGAIALLALSGCASSSGQGGITEGPGDREPYIGHSLSISTAHSDIGEIVVGKDDHTVYVFDDDEPGANTSACDATCLESWPPVISQDDPTGDGVHAKLGTFTRVDGFEQVTIDGQPLYYYSGDKAAGDVEGQGKQGLWWAVDPEGHKITEEH
jgi:predicted lipoprotein with Yx(FWY)xxD motif